MSKAGISPSSTDTPTAGPKRIRCWLRSWSSSKSMFWSLRQAQRRWRKWVTTRRLTALVGVLGLAFGIWNAVFKDVREKKLAREAVVAELEALADDVRAFVVPRRASRSSAPTFDKETNELFERKFWGRVVGLRDAVQREYRQSDWRLNATPADLDSMGEVAAGLSELADRVRAGRP